MTDDSTQNPKMSGRTYGYVVLRITLGVNMFVHGAVRIFGDYTGFVQWVTDSFQHTILPLTFVRIWAYVLPHIEAIIGICLLLGLFTAQALIAGGLLMAALVFGMGLKQNWDTVSMQMVYALIFYVLLREIRFNIYSLDSYFRLNDR